MHHNFIVAILLIYQKFIYQSGHLKKINSITFYHFQSNTEEVCTEVIFSNCSSMTELNQNFIVNSQFVAAKTDGKSNEYTPT